MEAHDVADRTTLRARWRQHPDWPARWPARAFAEQLGRSPSWVRKWLARFRAAPEDDALLWGRSRARKHPPPPVPAVVVERILEIRDQPPERLQRTPGPKAILYSPHHRSPELPAAQLPCSTRTIWKILRAHDRLAPRRRRRRIQPLDRPAPLSSWPLDCKDASTVPPEPDGKQQYVVAILNVVEVGTSLLLTSAPGADYTAETVFAPLVATLHCARTAGPVGSPAIAIRASSAAPVGTISPPPSCASGRCWASRSSSVRPGGPIATPS